MKNFGSKVVRFLKSEDGPTAVEYAVMVSLVIIAAIATQDLSAFNLDLAGLTVDQVTVDIDQRRAIIVLTPCSVTHPERTRDSAP